MTMVTMQALTQYLNHTIPGLNIWLGMRTWLQGESCFRTSCCSESVGGGGAKRTNHAFGDNEGDVDGTVV